MYHIMYIFHVIYLLSRYQQHCSSTKAELSYFGLHFLNTSKSKSNFKSK